ncbi:neprilysin-1-like [Amblyomma americanum]
MSGERHGFTSTFLSMRSTRGKMSGFAKLWAVFLAVVLLGAILFSVTRLARRRKPAALTELTCSTPSCLLYQKLLEDAVDNDADPCEDYYSYVCGLWTRSHEISVKHMQLHRFIADAVERMKLFPTVTSKVTEKGTKFFQACLSVLNTSHVAGVKKLLAEGGVMWPNRNPKPDFLNALFYMSRSLFTHVVFKFTVENGSVLVVSLCEDFMKLLATLRGHIKSRHLLRHLRTTYEAFGALDDSRLTEIIDHFESLEAFIDTYSNASIFQSLVSKVFPKNDTASFFRLTPSVPRDRWEAALRRHLSLSFSDLSEIVVQDVDSFTTVFNLHESIGEAPMNDVIETLCVQSLVQYTSFDIIVSFHRSTEVATEQLQENCFLSTFTFFGYDINHFFLLSRRHSLGNLERLAENVRHAYSVDLHQSVSSPRRAAVVQNKTDANFRHVFALLKKSKAREYPSSYYVYPEMTSEPLINWKMLNEYYFYNRSVGDSSLISYGVKDFAKFKGFSLLVQHLDYPYYAPDAHRGIVLGGIGSRLAAAVFYDYVESHADFHKIYKRNHQCLAGNSSDEPDLDLQGAVAAVPVVASMLRTASMDNDDALVKNLPPFKTDRLVFLFGCYLLCGQQNGGSMCNVPMRHSVDFSDAYNCPARSPMNPTDKCTMAP